MLSHSNKYVGVMYEQYYRVREQYNAILFTYYVFD